jgi:hypothetical protein
MPDSTIIDQRRADRLRGRAQRLTASIDNVPEALAAVIRAARVDLRGIGESKRLADDAKRADMNARRDELQAAVDEIEAGALQAVRDVEQLAADATARTPGDATTELLREQQLARTWERVRRLLDAGGDVAHIARRAAQANDRTVFDALAAELPDYFRAEGREGELDGAVALIDHAAAPVRTALEVAARDIVRDARKAYELAGIAISFARSDGETADWLPTADGKGITIAAQGAA